MSARPRGTMWVGETLLHAGQTYDLDDPLVVARPELFVLPEPEPEDVTAAGEGASATVALPEPEPEDVTAVPARSRPRAAKKAPGA